MKHCKAVIFFGIQLHKVKMEAGLPWNKVSKMRELLTQFLARQKCTLKELHTLLDVLNCVCIVTEPGLPI